MAANADVEMMREVQRQLVAELRELAPILVSAQLGADGSAFGDESLDRGRRIERFLMDAESGALDILKVQSPGIYADYVKQYIEDVNASPLVQPVPQPEPMTMPLMGV